MTKKLILASGSPQRRELLAAAGYEFDVLRPDEAAECGVCSGETPPEMVARLAWQKAADVRPQVTDAVVLACDTVAECDGMVLGKPRDEAHARAMLQRLSGRRHRVYSGLCLWPTDHDEPLVEVATTTLLMREIDDAELEEYLASDLWIGKAGAFGLQDRLGWITIDTGSESNVIGLPMELLAEMLAKLNG
ncbi:MAG: septum formation protein Maf [Planctomycetales bacterium]|nr:septum formation protein Maf [Planctomycetales bacterium]